MSIVRSAALAVVRLGGAVPSADHAPRVLIGHMGGPLWARKERSWSIPKGLLDDDEDPAAAARRELAEETGYRWPAHWSLVDLGDFRITAVKTARVFLGVEPAGSAPPWTEADFASNSFELEWPPRSGRVQSFPEIDRAEFCTLERARQIVVAGQVPVIDAIGGAISIGGALR